MRTTIASCFVLFVLTPSLLSAGEGVGVSFSVQAVQIQDTIKSRLSAKAEWSFVAEEVESVKRVVEAGTVGNATLAPGSLMKLFVTGAVLEKNLKEPIDFSTVVAMDGNVSKGMLSGDVTIKGAGNAFLSVKDLLEAVKKIQSLGVQEIAGDIVIDDSLFDARNWKSRYTGPAYGVPSALGLDMHTVSVTAEAKSQRVIIDPPNDSVKVSFNPSGKPGIRQIDDLTYEVTGVTLDAPTVHNRFSLADPGLYAGGTFLTLLRESGIKVAGVVKRKVAPSPPIGSLGGRGAGKGQIREIARIGSRDINRVISDTNRHSLNVVADNLLFLLGAKTYGAPGTREKGIQTVTKFVTDMGVPLKGMIIDDGSGVSERNRVSAEQMVMLLRAVARRPWFTTFSDSLSRPGIDGRLKDFGYKSERIRAKSGQLRDAYCLAGYVDRVDGKRLAFAYMVSGSGSDIQAASNAAAEVLKYLEN
jgi:D-alanyl-D-alanine carboxypeptidase/D-alanyl-D-alanine-endopeptidase (penicillin-binding protein 4)